MISDKIGPHHLERKELLYVRQSSAQQVLHNPLPPLRAQADVELLKREHHSCSRGWMDNAEPRCIAFGGLRVDDAVEHC